MIGQNLDKRRLILRLEQRFDRACGQLVKGAVDGCKDRERPGALQRVNQSGGLNSSDERRMIFRVNGVFDDILCLKHRGPADHWVTVRFHSHRLARSANGRKSDTQN